MSRAMLVFLVLFILAIATQVESAELISLKLCVDQDYSRDSRDCTLGKGLVGKGIIIDHTVVKNVYCLTTFRTNEKEEIYHVWFFKGNRLPQEKPTVYVEKNKSFVDDIKSELEWLKKQKDIGPVQAIAAIVKLVISPSIRYRTNSSKILGPEWVGTWKIQIYNTSNPRPLGEVEFEVK